MSLSTIQNNAIHKLKNLRAGALFMSMGTGKTKVALDLAISRQDDYDVLLWIAPASLLRSSTYQDEFGKWNAGLTRPMYQFTVVSRS